MSYRRPESKHANCGRALSKAKWLAVVSSIRLARFFLDVEA